MTNAYSYVRFSSAEQSQGDSERRQVDLATAWCKRNGAKLDTKLELFDPGLSAYNGDHLRKGCLGKFLKSVTAGRVPRGSVLLVENIDRLTREGGYRAAEIVMQLLAAGVELVTLSPEERYSQSDPMGIIKLGIAAMRGQSESQIKSTRVAAAYATKRAKARLPGGEKVTSQCPCWLTLSKDRTSFNVIPERAALVRRLFDWTLSGMGKGTIARRLNAEGVPAWGRGDGWHDSYVYKILHAPAVYGEYQPHRLVRHKRVVEGDPIPNYFPAIVDRETYDRVQLRKFTNTPGKIGAQVSNLFSGLVADGYSGAAMVYASKVGKKNGSAAWVYLTTDAKRKDPKAKSCTWQYTQFESLVLDYVYRLDWQAVAESQARPDAEAVKLDVLRAELVEMQSTLDRLMRLASTTNDPPRRLVEEMRSLELSQATAEAAIAKAATGEALIKEAKSVDLPALRTLIASKSNVDIRLKLREELRKIIDRIVVWPHGTPENIAKEIEDEFTRMLCIRGTPLMKIHFRGGAVRWLFVTPDGSPLVLDEHGGPMPGLECYKDQPDWSEQLRKKDV